VGIGIIDTGVFPHPELQERRNAISFFSDLINGYLKPYDDNGHGTFISGCIASQGEYPGIAPDSSLYMIKAFDSSGNGFMSDIIKGIDILITSRQKYNLRVICLPFEFPYLNETSIEPLIEIIKKAIKLNILVMACSGNLGSKPYTIYPPGSIKDVVTVGGADCNGYDLNNIRVSGFSGRGPLLNGASKPDIIAPCANITSLSSNTSYIPGVRKTPTFDNKYRSASGTSIACAIMSGICALILEKNPNLTSNDLKSILTISSQTTGESKYAEGSGLFNFEKIIK
jgi:serine protease AprX